MTYEWLAILILTVSWVMLYVAYCRLIDVVVKLREAVKANHEYITTVRDANGAVFNGIKEQFDATARLFRSHSDWMARQREVNQTMVVGLEQFSNQMTGYCERIQELENEVAQAKATAQIYRNIENIRRRGQ